MKLPYDYARCRGWECSKREDCARYTNLENTGPWTPIMQRLCDYDVPEMNQIHYIPVFKVSNS